MPASHPTPGTSTLKATSQPRPSTWRMAPIRLGRRYTSQKPGDQRTPEQGTLSQCVHICLRCQYLTEQAQGAGRSRTAAVRAGDGAGRWSWPLTAARIPSAVVQGKLSAASWAAVRSADGMRACGVGDHRVASRRGQAHWRAASRNARQRRGSRSAARARSARAAMFSSLAGAGEPGDHLGGQAGRCLQGRGQLVGAEP